MHEVNAVKHMQNINVILSAYLWLRSNAMVTMNNYIQCINIHMYMVVFHTPPHHLFAMGGEHRMQMMFTTSSPAAHLESVTTIRRIRQLILVTANASDRIGCCDKAANRATDVSMLLLKTHITRLCTGLALGSALPPTV